MGHIKSRVTKSQSLLFRRVELAFFLVNVRLLRWITFFQMLIQKKLSRLVNSFLFVVLFIQSFFLNLCLCSFDHSVVLVTFSPSFFLALPFHPSSPTFKMDWLAYDKYNVDVMLSGVSSIWILCALIRPIRVLVRLPKSSDFSATSGANDL